MPSTVNTQGDNGSSTGGASTTSIPSPQLTVHQPLLLHHEGPIFAPLLIQGLLQDTPSPMVRSYRECGRQVHTPRARAGRGGARVESGEDPEVRRGQGVGSEGQGVGSEGVSLSPHGLLTFRYCNRASSSALRIDVPYRVSSLRGRWVCQARGPVG